MAIKLEKVQVPEAVFDGLGAAGAIPSDLSMNDVNRVVQWLGRNDFDLAARWIERNTDSYCQGLVAGFKKEGSPDCLKKLADYTDEEKCAEFDKLYRMAEEDFNHVREHGYQEKDSGHWMFEAVMNLLGGQDMWDAYNKRQ